MTRKQPIPTVECMTENILNRFNECSQSDIYQGTTWYDEAKEFCAAVATATPYTVEQVAAVVANLSPRTNWDANKQRAERLIAAHAAGKDMPAVHTVMQCTKAWAALTSDQPATTATGPKVSQFFSNIMGYLDFVTVDVWAYATATGIKMTAEQSVPRADYRPVTLAFQGAARTIGIPAAVLQAIVWGKERGSYK